MQRLTVNQAVRSGDPLSFPFTREDEVSQLTPSFSPQEDANRSSLEFHDLRIPGARKEIGLLKLEIIQCFGLPKLDALGETDAYGLAVCGSYAFRTDVIPESANPRWSSQSRRACLFPVFKAYARLFVGVFDADSDSDRDDFAGRVVIDLARLRPNSEYDVVLPLRQSAHVYMKRPRGTIRLRLNMEWHSERQAILSYLPEKLSFEPEPLTVACRDRKAFQTVATTVHGTHLPGRFSLKMVKALIREMTFTQVHVLRYLRKKELRNLITWQYPIISFFVFVAWMHGVYRGTFKYLPGHLLTFLLLHLWKNYAQFVVSESTGFVQPTWEELFGALVLGRNCIKPLRLSSSLSADRLQALGLKPSEGLHTQPARAEVSLHDVAVALRQGVLMKKRRSRFTFRGRDAVDFLVDENFSETREDAVRLGRELATKLRLFEHIDRKYPFRDERTHYNFLSESPVVATAPRPWGRPLFRALGFLRPRLSIDIAVDMPFAPGSEYPRMTVDGGMVHRSSRNTNRLNRSDSEDFDVSGSLGLNFGDNACQDQHFEDNCEDDLFGTTAKSLDESTIDQPYEMNGTPIVMLKPPPDQNIDTIAKADKPVASVLGDVRNEVHGYLFNAFNDRAFILKGKGVNTSRHDQLPAISERETILQKILRRNSRKQKTHRTITDDVSAFERVGSIRKVTATLSDMAATCPRKGNIFSFRGKSNEGVSKSDLEKLLKTGSASSSNPWMAKLGMVLQPIVEITLAFLSIFRSTYNLFTWRDPILAFLVSIFGPVLVVVLHLFPWRLALGLFGLAVFGPQHWFLRLWNERNGMSHPPDLDKVVSRSPWSFSLSENADGHCNEPTFSHRADTAAEDVESHQLRHVMVPHSQLMYNHRFYDWPPEPQYSRVGKPVPIPSAVSAVPEVAASSIERFQILKEGSDSSECDDDITLTYVRNVTQTQQFKTTQRARALGGGKFHHKIQ